MRYDFVCLNGHTAEVVLRMDERDSLQKCAHCGKLMRRKMSTGMAVIWGGRWADSGWINGKDGFDDGLGPARE